VEVGRRRWGGGQGRRRPPQVGQRSAGQQRRPRGLPPPQEVQRLGNGPHGQKLHRQIHFRLQGFFSSLNVDIWYYKSENLRATRWSRLLRTSRTVLMQHAKEM